MQIKILSNDIILQGSGGSRTVPLKEGEVNDIKIEVTAEDGTTKNYLVHVRRLSNKDATLGSLKLNEGILVPYFSPDTLSYTCKFKGMVLLIAYCKLALVKRLSWQRLKLLLL